MVTYKNEFKNLKEKLAENFKTRCSEGRLYEVDVDKDVLWNLYLDSFPKGTNLIYRTRREYDCSCCRQFIRNIGGTVFIDGDLNLHTIFEFDTGSSTFQPVMDALDAYVKSRSITDIYLNDLKFVGTDKSHEVTPTKDVITWEHFYLKLPENLVARRNDIGTLKGQRRDRRNVFKRSLDEISMDAVDTILELIASNTLYKGEEWREPLTVFKAAKTEYDALSEEKKELYTWRKTETIGDVVARIRNHSIGTLITNISEGMDLDQAVRSYETIVAPSNYKRPKAIFTKRMLEDAKKTIIDLGYMDSLARRYATLDDITVNNILFSNRDAARRISGDVFDEMMSDIPAKKFSKIEEITVDKFVSDVLPNAKEISVLLENKHAPNMVSLIAPVNKGSKTMFKWNNGFSWAYSGNITDSDIRERVKNAGGNINGVLRFSIQWNDTGVYSRNDLDAHCVDPIGEHIFFGHKQSAITRGFLDVDIINPISCVPAVENIAWESKASMVPGEYMFYVHQYTNRGGRDGFRAEIEFDGKIYRYNYDRELRQGEKVRVASVILDRNGNFSIKESLKSEAASREIWGLKSNTFVPVTVVMYSPNYWDDQNGIGHRHYFFMLKDCVNPETPNGFYNEFLKHELAQYKRVFEALGSKMAVSPTEDQLSGLGFSSTKRNDLIVKVKGATERTMKIKF